MSETKKIELTCIRCPLGCPLTVMMKGNEIESVSGNTCPRGEQYARLEVTDPKRVVTGSVMVYGTANGDTTVSCKTRSDVPKARVMAVAAALKGVAVAAPVKIGDVIIHDAAGTGVDIIATKDVA